ncbi:MAG: class I SAM-dependent methyltransferase [Bryobacteraceae bacterium]
MNPELRERMTSGCPVCLDQRYDVVGLYDRTGHPLTNVRCLCCGLVRVQPLPTLEQLRQFYEAEYRATYKGSSYPARRHVYRAARLALNRLRTVRPYLTRGSFVLDVGSGLGAFLYVLEHFGYVPTGIELDPQASRSSEDLLGCSVISSPLWEVDFPRESFEAITMYHVLEHLPDPLDALRRCWKWLDASGFLFVEVPNIGSVHQHPGKIFHPAHLFGFYPETLRFACESAGFRLLRLDVDRYDRNILGVFRKTAQSAESIRAPRPRCSFFPGQQSLLRYYLQPSTYVRSANRLVQFSRERIGVRGKSNARDILDTLIRKTSVDE